MNAPFISAYFFERSVHFRSFSSFFATYETHLNASFISVHLYWTEMNALNETFICTERKWTQWTQRSFLLNGNERIERNVHFHWTEMNVVNEPFISTERKWT